MRVLLLGGGDGTRQLLTSHSQAKEAVQCGSKNSLHPRGPWLMKCANQVCVSVYDLLFAACFRPHIRTPRHRSGRFHVSLTEIICVTYYTECVKCKISSPVKPPLVAERGDGGM